MKAAAVYATFALVAVPCTLRAQKITVAVVISDSAAGRIFQGAFASAFRTLGDVDLISLAEGPDYVLAGVVMCNPSCDDPASYSASLRFWSPIRTSTARAIARRTVNPIPRASRLKRADSVATDVIWPMVKGYELTHETWVASWGRSRYEQAIRELVREIDTDCFEKDRAYNRMFTTPEDTTRTSAIMKMIDARSWLC